MTNEQRQKQIDETLAAIRALEKTIGGNYARKRQSLAVLYRALCELQGKRAA